MLIMIRSHWWDDWMSSLLVRIHNTFRSQSKWGFLDYPGSFWNMMLNMSDNVGAPILRCGLISPI